ncbi:MAG: acetylxylan esterase [Bacteroidota bacterium]|nr:acetylxylan esterase [Bacteroidota bacterium]
MTRILTNITVILFSLQTLWAQNYDESKVLPYKLPELLQTQAREKVTTIKEWEKIRRPEILKLFEDNIYGQVPKDFDQIKFELKKEDKTAMGGKATLKEVGITVSRNRKSVTINLVMFVPNKVKKPVPIFLVINNRGIRTMDATRERKDGFWPAEEVIDAGYGIAGFDVKDAAPDNKTAYVKGVLELYPEQLKINNGMGVLSAWAWGASRAIDYLEKDKAVDAKKIMTVGHSRGGKASLWCGAQDKRVVIAISNDSGESGAAISRRNFGETIKDILRTFPYWFCKNYHQYIDNEDKLPVDQHMLLALIAPRGVYVGNAAEDLWADPKGQYLSLVCAQPVYGLYGFETDLPAEMPAVNERVFRSHMGFHNREGKHNMTPYDWQQFIAFANNYFQKNAN